MTKKQKQEDERNGTLKQRQKAVGITGRANQESYYDVLNLKDEFD